MLIAILPEEIFIVSVMFLVYWTIMFACNKGG